MLIVFGSDFTVRTNEEYVLSSYQIRSPFTKVQPKIYAVTDMLQVIVSKIQILTK